MKHKLIMEDFQILPSVGAVINTKTGDTFPLMADGSIGWDEPENIVDMWDDKFNTQEWFNSLHTLDKSIVDGVIKRLKHKKTNWKPVPFSGGK